MSIVFSILGMVLCGLTTKKINTNKGYDGGFAWGFFLGLIGIIIVAFRSNSPTKKTEVKAAEENESEQKLIASSKLVAESLKDPSCEAEVKENRPAISSVISSRIPETGEKDDFTDVDAKENRPAISSVVAHLKRTKLFLEDEEWNLAEEYCEKVLDEDPECGLAYFYKFMAKNRFSSPLKISTDYFIDEDRDIKKALRFSSDELKKQISYIVYRQKKAVYDYGISCFNERDYEKAKAVFLKIKDFEDAKQQIEKCQEKIRENEMWKQYHYAVSQMQNGSYEEALKIFSIIPNFSDVNVKIFQCKEEIKNAEQRKIEDKYNQACTAMQDKNFNSAISLFNEIIDFQDSRAKIGECNQGIKKATEKEKKFKRILLFVLLGVLLIFATYYFIGQTYWNKDADGHWHNLQEHVAHRYSLTVITDSTCTEEGKGINACTVCGYEQPVTINKKAHTSDTGVVTKEPTCTKKGIKTYSCTVCGQTIKTEDIAAKGHTSDSGKITKEPTCTQSGIKTYTCTVCGQVLKTVTVKSKAHTSDSGKITKEPTCTQSGTKTYTCTVCGQKLKTASIAAKGHSYVNYKCTGCNQGTAGGYVFYDVDADNDSGNADGLKSSECGWRYLEAAPTDLSGTYYFGYYRTSSSSYYRTSLSDPNSTVGTKTSIGTGKANTKALVKAMGETAYTDSSGTTKGIYAAKACVDYSITVNGVVYDDWFLPSKDELNLMYTNLNEKGSGRFFGSYYWSSSEDSSCDAWLQNFFNGNQSSSRRGNNVYTFYLNYDYYVRPVRAF